MIRALGRHYKVKFAYEVEVDVIAHDEDEAQETAERYVSDLLDDDEVKILDCNVGEPECGEEALEIIREDD